MDKAATNTTNEANKELYDECHLDVARVADWIDLELLKHRKHAKARGFDDEHVNRITQTREKIIEALAILTQCEPKEIEDTLDECHCR